MARRLVPVVDSGVGRDGIEISAKFILIRTRSPTNVGGVPCARIADNWVYNEERLALARGPDALTTRRAVGYLINLHVIRRR
jgi:hypothetical protein